MSAYIFICNSRTESECLRRLLFGTDSRSYARFQRVFEELKVGDRIFLYNYDAGTLRGPFAALTPCRNNIEPNAWKGSTMQGFPWQVRVNATEEYDEPLTADELRNILRLSNTSIGLVPPTQIEDRQAEQLIRALRQKNGDDTPIFSRLEQTLCPAYIFKCNRITGGRCFDDNVMGAPVALFRPVVSNIQPAATILLWQMEEHKLYGVWRASSRGQYDATAFPEVPHLSLHAVVYCERQFPLEKGLDETTVRGILPYDQPMPPYKIEHGQAEKLVDALFKANSSIVTKEPQRGADVGEYVAEDGHRVRSKSELLIDNWLYNHGELHAYEKRVQLRSNYMCCDFFLPEDEIYIEFWGLVGNGDYDRRREQKLRAYQDAGIKLVELFPTDVTMLHEVLPGKLKEHRRNRGKS